MSDTSITMSQFPIYESRLRAILSAITNMSDTQLTREWRKYLDRHSLEDLGVALSAMTSDSLKAMLSRDDPPTVAELKSLEPVRDNHNPGVYLGLMQPTTSQSADQKAYAYTGSATKVGRGFQGRVPSHLDPTYRESYLKKNPNYYHYTLLADGSRAESYFVLAQTE
jgi:hypothetical protein